MKKLKRNISVLLRLSESEKDLLEKKMEAANIKNREAYLRKMALDGYILHLDLSDIRYMLRLLANSTNNINQISRKINETQIVYAEDIRQVKDEVTRMRRPVSEILEVLNELRG